MASKGINKVLAIGAILGLLGGLFMLVGPAGRIPLMDANRTLLAETSAEGYCAAPAHFNGWQQAQYDECVQASGKGAEKDISQVILGFCQGVIEAGWDGTVSQCEDIVAVDQLWPTKERTDRGWLSNSWNHAFPYPGSLVGIGTQSPDDSRTGERDGNLRDGDIARP